MNVTLSVDEEGCLLVSVESSGQQSIPFLLVDWIRGTPSVIGLGHLTYRRFGLRGNWFMCRWQHFPLEGQQLGNNMPLLCLFLTAQLNYMSLIMWKKLLFLLIWWLSIYSLIVLYIIKLYQINAIVSLILIWIDGR